jgi:glycosyltransferase involved in cell wall biosynthesis
MHMALVSSAPNGEDVPLRRALRDVAVGFYIEVGATRPTHDSAMHNPATHNSATQAFYQRGWHGINLAPDADRVNALTLARPRDINLQMAVTGEAGQSRCRSFAGSGSPDSASDAPARHEAGERRPEEPVPEARTLAEVCAQHVDGEIHFLRIDAGGCATQIVADGDFTRFRPWIVVVASTAANAGKPVPRAWEPALAAAGYQFAGFDAACCYYVAAEHARRLLPLLAAPTGIGVPPADLARSAALEAAARRADAGEHPAAQTEARARDAELRMPAEATKFRLPQAACRRTPPAIAAADDGTDPDRSEHSPPRPGAQRLFLDATLILRHGFISAVGIVRVEHYVAEYLAGDPAVALQFVVFDHDRRVFRSVTSAERKLLQRILFHRYRPPATDRPGGSADPVTMRPADTVSDSDAAAVGGVPDTVAMGVAATHPQAGGRRARRARSPAYAGHWLRLRTQYRLAASLTRAELTLLLHRVLLRRMPIRPEHSAPRRAATRLTRRALLHGARAGHRIVRAAAAMHRRMTDPVRRLIAPDPIVADAFASQEPLLHGATLQREPAIGSTPAAADPAPFEPGDVLLSMANTWDYMDYRYLARLGPEMGVRLISVVYDVVAMELPFVTPAPAHLYHRHWVEIGHASERLIAISRFSKENYERYIAGPNAIDVPVDHAPLPNFLRERAAEIGEAVVSEMEGRSFVVYCSTIEVRKNHILLLHLWEELRQRISPASLPILVFVGKWGWSAETVRLLAERNWRLRPHLRVMTEISDAELIWLYRHARFTVFPSLTEGFGLAAAESLSFGTPVVISHCPALLEATEHLMPALHPHDFMGWLAELERLIVDDDYLDLLRQAATRFRGPAYDVFAAKIRDAALAAPGIGGSASRLLLVERDAL